jgi:hypothetical protein
MARTASRSRPVARFSHPAKVDVYLPTFELLKSVRHLDIDRLARAASAEFEVGYFKTRCCQYLVRAVVRRGMVTKLVSEPGPDSGQMAVSREFANLLDVARRRAMQTLGRRSSRLPMPLHVFMRDPAAAVTMDEPSVWCFKICIYGYCLECCLFKFPGDRYGTWGCGISREPSSPSKL